MSARAVAVTQPAPTMIARLVFLRILSGKRPVARFPLLIRLVLSTSLVIQRVEEWKLSDIQAAFAGGILPTPRYLSVWIERLKAQS
jgi:hypothetical protein